MQALRGACISAPWCVCATVAIAVSVNVSVATPSSASTSASSILRLPASTCLGMRVCGRHLCECVLRARPCAIARVPVQLSSLIGNHAETVCVRA
eukprot:3865007-Pleurochrysis_carterae.AAC.1